MLTYLKGLISMISAILAAARAIALLLEAFGEITKALSSDPVLRDKLTAAKEAASEVANHKAE